MKQYLYLMLGYPGSGKSHFALGLAEKTGAVRFNSDRMRHYLYENPHEHHDRKSHEEIANAISAAASSVMQAGYSVICDLNNNFTRDRLKYSALASRHNVSTVIIWVKTPLEVAIERGANRPLSQEHIRVTPAWVKRVAAEIEAPQPDELCIEIDGTQDFQLQYDSFRKQLRKLKRRTLPITLFGQTEDPMAI